MGFSVMVREGTRQTRHDVTMMHSTYQRLTNGRVTPAACIEAAFNFLLEREPQESILARFDITTIATYFPRFEQDFPRYVVGRE